MLKNDHVVAHTKLRDDYDLSRMAEGSYAGSSPNWLGERIQGSKCLLSRDLINAFSILSISPISSLNFPRLSFHLLENLSYFYRYANKGYTISAKRLTLYNLKAYHSNPGPLESLNPSFRSTLLEMILIYKDLVYLGVAFSSDDGSRTTIQVFPE